MWFGRLIGSRFRTVDLARSTLEEVGGFVAQGNETLFPTRYRTYLSRLVLRVLDIFLICDYPFSISILTVLSVVIVAASARYAYCRRTVVVI